MAWATGLRSPLLSGLKRKTTANDPELLVQTGMRAVLRDLQEWVALNERPDSDTGIAVSADHLKAYLLALFIVAGGFDGES